MSTAPNPPGSLSPHQEFLIDDLLPAREVSLIAGPSGAGKTTLLVQLIEWFRAGEPIFGKRTHSAPVVYITCDRSRASFLRSLDRHNVPHDAFPWEPARKILSAGAKSDPLRALLDWVHTKHPLCRLLCVDGLGSLVPDGKISDYSIVADFLTAAQFRCESYNLTLLGTVHATKVKAGEQFLNPRQRILGSVAWAAYTDLIVVVEPDDTHPDSQVRTVNILPRDSQEFTVKLENRGGVLIPFEDAVDLDLFDILTSKVQAFAPSDVISTNQLIEMGAGVGLSRATVYRWIEDSINSGSLAKTSYGKYSRVSRA